ncbi:HvfC/BufC N-terminal domain-containing protein [Novosphingobium huizhouense]|uniref:HvfC/BufC N-terminal domain-containing protein n=1 Tax=Novosphingobium huizhouense TaxID=2866625 RepID=UPI001CD8A574|nr:DNA-binding domain-containing protein [Novosphingobium huizhouense]
MTCTPAAPAADMPLATLQRAFRDWLVEGDEAAAQPLGAASGLAVYQNNYRSALVESLEASYPRLLAWLGSERFAACAATYADAHPPHHWTLDAFGDRLAGMLAELYPDDPEIADLARLDWALGQAFVAADAVPIGPADLAAVDWDSAAIRFVPSFDRLVLRGNADAIWRALVSGEAPPQPRTELPSPVVVVWRQGFETVMRRLDEDERRVFDLARSGLGFAATCETLAQGAGEEAAVALAGRALGRWLGEAMVAAID